MKTNKIDKSTYVFQRDKLKKQPLIIRERITWTEKQKKFLEIALDKNTRIMFVRGPAGTSKTLISVYVSLKLLNEGRISDIIYARSAVESSDSHLGFLPGSADDKLSYYRLPLMDKLDELLSKNDVDMLIKEQRVSMYPVNFSRGLSWNAKAIILDESQNSSRKEIITMTTRLGHYNKLFVLADPLQTDLPSNRAGGFEEIFSLTKENEKEANSHGIFTFEFDKTDIVRSELVKFLVNLYEKLKPKH